MRLLKIFPFILILAILTLSCSVQKMAMNSVVSFTKEDAIPYLMSQDDVNSAATMGESMASLIASMQRLEVETSEVEVATWMASGMAAEILSRNAELRRIRAVRENRSSEAQDALIEEKQAHALAASRFFSAYSNAVKAYGDLSEACASFKDETSQLLALLGLASGALALIHDFNSEKSVGISLEVPVKIEKALVCFDDNAWWGIPSAIRASIWLSIPGSGPKDLDPLAVMKEAAKIGDESGVFLSRALYVQMAKSVGKQDLGCQALADFASDEKINKDLALLSAYAKQMANHQANIIWSQEKGHRAIFGQMTCPADAQSSDDLDELDNLLDGLGESDVIIEEGAAP